MIGGLEPLLEYQPMQFPEPNLFNEQPAPQPPRRHELAIEILKFLTPLLGFLLLTVSSVSKYPWLSKPWVLNSLIALGVLVLIWFAKPRITAWLQRRGQREREKQFIETNDARLREFVDQFGEFISTSNTKSFLSIIRSAHSQNMTAVEQVISGDYIGNWYQSYREQLEFPTTALPQFLARSREFTNIVQQFNSYYVLRAQRHFAAATKPLPEHDIEELEGFREEYAAFLRNVQPWAKGIANYLQSQGMKDHPLLWRHAPTNYFEKVKPFGKSKSTPA
jgi:hypothetical protein